MTIKNTRVLVEDNNGNHYRLVKASEQSWLVKDIDCGQYRFIDADELHIVHMPTRDNATDTGRFDAGNPIREVQQIIEQGPISVVSLLDRTILCESTLHATLWALRSAGTVEECTVDGRRGYRSSIGSRENKHDTTRDE